MTRCSRIRSTGLVLLFGVAILGVAAGQSPQKAPAAASANLPVFPAPTNLKVLPKDLTGQQIHALMKQWAAALGVGCDACHLRVTEGTRIHPNPHLDFADDARPMKAAARLMYSMTEQINNNYIASLNGSGVPVTCGTCHRGVVSPAPFAPPPPDPVPAQSAANANKEPLPR